MLELIQPIIVGDIFLKTWMLVDLVVKPLELLSVRKVRSETAEKLFPAGTEE